MITTIRAPSRSAYDRMNGRCASRRSCRRRRSWYRHFRSADRGGLQNRFDQGQGDPDGEVRLVADRRSKQTPEDRLFQQRTALDIYRELEQAHFRVRGRRRTRGALAERVRAAARRTQSDRAAVSTSWRGPAGLCRRLHRRPRGLLRSPARSACGRSWATSSVRSISTRPPDQLADRCAGRARRRSIASKPEFDRLAAEIRSASAAAEKRKLAPIPPRARGVAAEG